MYSEVYKGEVLDWKFKPFPGVDYITSFYIGDIYIGRIYKMGRRKWTAVSYSADISLVNGFGTRTDAAMYLLERWRDIIKKEVL